MISKIHKINDKVFFQAIILILILWNLKYFILPVQIIFTSMTRDIFAKNMFYPPVQALRTEIKNHPDFFDEEKIGFVSDINQANVFDLEDSIKSFYVAQYAVAPSVMKNDSNADYVIGAFFKKISVPEGFYIVKKLTSNLYLLKSKKLRKEKI